MPPTLLDPKRRLGDMLVARGYISDETLQSALQEQNEGKGAKLLGEVLLEREYCTEEQLLECLAVEFGVPYVRLDNRMFDPETFDLIPREFVEKHNVLPLFRVRDVLTVAVAEPTNVFLLDQIKD